MDEDALDSFTPMQLDVFHAMWELYHNKSHGTRPPVAATNMERDTLDKAHALSEVPMGTVVWRNFVEQEGKTYRYRGVIYDYKPPYYRIRHRDGDWKELTINEVNRGMERAFQRGNMPEPGAKGQGGSHGQIRWECVFGEAFVILTRVSNYFSGCSVEDGGYFYFSSCYLDEHVSAPRAYVTFVVSV